MNIRTLSNTLYRALLIINSILWAMLIGSFFLFEPSVLEPVGREFGSWALYTLWIVALPGILKRFSAKGFLQKAQIIIMRSRRRLGILAFTLIAIHFSWQRLFYYIHDGLPSISDIPPFELMGMIAFTLLIPLFLTSNNTSLKLLKKTWDQIHTLMYPAMWLVGFHLALQGSYPEAAVTFVIASLQIASWVAFHKKKQTKPLSASQV